MIEYLKGRLVTKDPTYVVIDVNGVGYKVLISLNTFSEIKDKEDILLLTHLHIKEDAHTLYGFNKEAEKKMFLKLISISGIGPSTGLMIQSSLSASDLRNAILHEDVNTIKGVKGVGAKTAQRLILELKDSISKDGFVMENEIISTPYNTMKFEALSAMVTLGINKITAEKSIEAILKKSENTITLEDLIKQALKNT